MMRVTYGDDVLVPVVFAECRRVDRPHNHLDLLRSLFDKQELSGSYFLVSHIIVTTPSLPHYLHETTYQVETC